MKHSIPHGFTCLCGECAKAQRTLKLAAMRAVQDAITEAQKQQRAYSWHRCFSLAMGARS